ncbi:MAG: hypothetical protein M3323_01360 [Actinomycetota bacterium]|nr:hypothetical protein [Actinomycetota bacterium]
MKKKLIALVAAAVAVVPFTSGTASAQGAGALAFECEAFLSAFPSPGASGECKGTVEPLGIAAGGAAGVGTEGPYALVGPGDFNASFTYAEGCVANEPPAIGTANGTATITGVPAVNKGELTTANASLVFSWTRVGLTAAITISDMQITFANGGSDNPALGVATAGFAPVLTQNNTCPSGGPLTAVVAGAAAFGG